MSGDRIGHRYQIGDSVIKRNPNGRSRRGWILAPAEQRTTRGTRMPAYVIRWRDSERPERVLQHMLVDDPEGTPPEDPSVLTVDVPAKLLSGS
ncbi:hypothetical protein [Vulcanococcus limneticus]|uniref:hypothetical protein n=1 Tax=Vulcanococcus limneticus TaxID=2170428 RepID=UPI000B99CEF3|nr:hypothetical protein [Vulcanococcus limneticus]MCP9793079.1 hypothetical protein [Vulcanococcus limneticus MW73D5]MCP9895041.1 hypothetical protein [Vulcanococcus limneticus Candia 3F8]MCP9898459.1 hypothetical protein [Vulcanococcus limneticus Candia 3B3]